MSVNNSRAVCPECGADLFSPEALFCVQCGARISKDASTEDTSLSDVGGLGQTVSVDYDDDVTMLAYDNSPRGSHMPSDRPQPFGQPQQSGQTESIFFPDSPESSVDESEKTTFIPASLPGEPIVTSAENSRANFEKPEVSEPPITESEDNDETYSPEAEYARSVFGDDAENETDAPDDLPIEVFSVQDSQQPFQSPQQPFQSPQQPFQSPQQPFQNPQQVFQNPQQVFQNPQQVFQNPQQPFQSPQQPFQSPQQPFQSPQQPFQNPQQPFQNPQQPFQSPQQPFQSPQQPFQIPQQPFQNSQQPFQNPQQPFQNPQQPYYNPLMYSGRLPVTAQPQKKAKGQSVKKKINKKLVIIIVSIAAGLIILAGAAFAVWKLVITPSNEYEKACALMDDGEYDDAIEIFEDLGDYKDCSEKITESKYQKALRTLDDGEYTIAEELFKELGDYRDSEDMALESKYKYGISLIEDEYYTQAISVFEDLDDYAESSYYLNEAKYLYCKESSDCTDSLTYEYMTELKNIKYKDSEKLYHKIYDLSLEVIFCNTDSYDEDTVNYSVSKYCTYFHIGFRVSGGTPDETFDLYRVVTYPDGKVYNSSDDPWTDRKNGSSCSIYWEDGFYSNPEYGMTGNLYIDMYNKKTKKRVKRVTVKITG